MEHYRRPTTASAFTTISEAPRGDRCRTGKREVTRTLWEETPRGRSCWWSNPKAEILPAMTGLHFAWDLPALRRETKRLTKSLLADGAIGALMLMVFTAGVSIISFTTATHQFIRSQTLLAAGRPTR